MKQWQDKTLRDKVYWELRHKIGAMHAGQNRFVPEDELARELGVSRATVRESMQRLQKEGYLTSRRGKGNFGHPSVDRLRQRLDLTSDFMKLLDDGCGAVACRCLFWGEGEPSAKMRKRCVGGHGRVFRQHWQYTVGDAPQIFCKIETPLEVAVKPPQPPQGAFNLVAWLAEYYARDVAYFGTHFSCGTDADAVAALALAGGTYMQNWQEVVFDITDREVSFSDIYFHPENVDISMILKY